MQVCHKQWEQTFWSIQLTFWQQSMNSSMVTTPSLFLSIFCWTQKEGNMKNKWRSYAKASLLWLTRAELWTNQQHTCLEENFYVLTRRLLFEDGVCAFSHHVIDGLHDVKHFLWHEEKDQFIPPIHRFLRMLRFGDFPLRDFCCWLIFNWGEWNYIWAVQKREKMTLKKKQCPCYSE